MFCLNMVIKAKANNIMREIKKLEKDIKVFDTPEMLEKWSFFLEEKVVFAAEVLNSHLIDGWQVRIDEHTHQYLAYKNK